MVTKKSVHVLILVLLSLMLRGTNAGACPQKCKCSGTVVNCDNAGLNSIPNNIPETTTELSMANNELPSLPANGFASLTNLEVLKLSKNSISQIDDNAFNGLSNLWKLMLSNNDLSSIPELAFRNLPALKKLYLRSNDLSAIGPQAFESNSALQYLHLGLNRQLTAESVDRNAFDGLDSLIYLEMYSTSLTAVPRLHKLPNLEVLDLTDNDITTLDAGSFAEAPALQEIYLDSNELSSETIDVEAFSGLPNLHKLFLRSNKFTAIPTTSLKELPALEEIYFDYNAIGPTMENAAFAAVPSLRYIDLRYNALKRMNRPFSGLEESLERLNLNGNVLKEVPTLGVRNLAELNFLHLGSNEITSVPSWAFGTNRKLDILYLNHNPLTEVADDAFYGLENITQLHIYQTFLNSIPVKSILPLQNLNYLQLQRNNISQVSGHAFKNNTNLSHLYLYENVLSDIDSEAFAELADLKTLRVDTNSLRYLPDKTLDPLLSIREVYANDNPWDCNCDLLYLKEWEEAHPGVVQNQEDTVCQVTTVNGVETQKYESPVFALSVSSFGTCP